MSGPGAENSGPSTSSGSIQNAVTTGINRLKNKFKIGRQGKNLLCKHNNTNTCTYLKFGHSEKHTKFEKKWKIFSNFVCFSKRPNFKYINS